LSEEAQSKKRNPSTGQPAFRPGPSLRNGGSIPSLGEIGLNQFAPYLMNRVAGRWNVNVQKGLGEFELTVVKMRTLAVLSVIPSLSINELSVFTVTEQSTMSRTLESMVEQGLVIRRQQKDDARVREVEISSLGRETFAAYWPALYAEFTKLFAGVSEEEFNLFVKVLHKLVRNQEG
jgi:MarR family transcriptional regulator for hemolysin